MIQISYDNEYSNKFLEPAGQPLVQDWNPLSLARLGTDRLLGLRHQKCCLGWRAEHDKFLLLAKGSVSTTKPKASLVFSRTTGNHLDHLSSTYSQTDPHHVLYLTIHLPNGECHHRTDCISNVLSGSWSNQPRRSWAFFTRISLSWGSSEIPLAALSMSEWMSLHSLTLDLSSSFSSRASISYTRTRSPSWFLFGIRPNPVHAWQNTWPARKSRLWLSKQAALLVCNRSWEIKRKGKCVQISK